MKQACFVFTSLTFEKHTQDAFRWHLKLMPTHIEALAAQRSHCSEESPFAAINYRVNRAVRAEEAAALARQRAERPRSPRTVSSRKGTHGQCAKQWFKRFGQ